MSKTDQHSNEVTPIQSELKGITPLIADDCQDTMERVASVLTYLRQHKPDNSSTLNNETWNNWCYGRSLIYQTMVQALTVKEV